jgi:Single-strand binding protein family
MERQDDIRQEIGALEAYMYGVEPVREELGCDGIEGFLGKPESGISVQIFPAAGIARIRTGLADVTMRRVHLEVDGANDALYLSGATGEEWTRTHIYRDGGVVFSRFPVSSTPRTETGETLPPAGIPSVAPATQEEVPSRSGRDESLDARTSPPAENQKEQKDEPQPRVTLFGRLGYAPRFRTTPKGTLVASFAVAMHEENRTTWHNVRLFGEKAAKLQEKGYAKGDELEVIGYLHTRERTNSKTGETTPVEEIYAAVVRRPGGTQEEDSSPTADASGEE